MILNNTQQIRTEDFESEHQTTIAKLAEILNPFMQQVVDLSSKRIDFENRVEVFKTVEFSVDSQNNPTLNNKINIEKNGLRGIQVISAFNLTNPTTYPTSQPFIVYTPVSSNIIQINKITGLVPNNKYRLNIIIY